MNLCTVCETFREDHGCAGPKKFSGFQRDSEVDVVDK